MKPPGKPIFPAAGRQVPFYGLKLFDMSVALFDTFRNGDGWGMGIVPDGLVEMGDVRSFSCGEQLSPGMFYLVLLFVSQL